MSKQEIKVFGSTLRHARTNFPLSEHQQHQGFDVGDIVCIVCHCIATMWGHYDA